MGQQEVSLSQIASRASMGISRMTLCGDKSTEDVITFGDDLNNEIMPRPILKNMAQRTSDGNIQSQRVKLETRAPKKRRRELGTKDERASKIGAF